MKIKKLILKKSIFILSFSLLFLLGCAGCQDYLSANFEQRRIFHKTMAVLPFQSNIPNFGQQKNTYELLYKDLAKHFDKKQLQISLKEMDEIGQFNQISYVCIMK